MTHARYLDVDAPPFARNPSAWSQRVPIAVLAAAASLVSAYLALFQWGLVQTVWDPVGDGSARVLTSEPSRAMHRWLGIPLAALAALSFLGAGALALAGSTRRWQYRPWLVMLLGLDVIPLGVASVALVVVLGTLIGAFSTLHVVTAFLSLALIALTWDEAWTTLRYLGRVRRAGGATWRAFVGRYDPVADDVAQPNREVS